MDDRSGRGPRIWRGLAALNLVLSLLATLIGLLSTDYTLLQERLRVIGDFFAGLPWSGTIETARFKFGSELGPIYLVAIMLVLLINYYEWREKRIPNMITYPGVVVGVGMSALLTSDLPLASLGGMALAFAAGTALASATYFPIKAALDGDGLGMGVVKMGAMVGAFFGYSDTIWFLIVSILAAAIGLLVYLKWTQARGRVRSALEIELGPFLTVGAVTVVLLPLTSHALTQAVMAVVATAGFCVALFLAVSLVRAVR